MICFNFSFVLSVSLLILNDQKSMKMNFILIFIMELVSNVVKGPKVFTAQGCPIMIHPATLKFYHFVNKTIRPSRAGQVLLGLHSDTCALVFKS